MTEAVTREVTDKFPCKSCGGNMTFDPATALLICGYCGAKVNIVNNAGIIKEYDFDSVEEPVVSDWGSETKVIHCDSCGAETVLEASSTAQFCAFCGSSHIVKNNSKVGIVPESLIPFKVTVKEAADYFAKWVKGRFFAPGVLKKNYQMQKIKGVYIPFWTYDTETYSVYTGEGGTYYYETVTKWVEENGKTVQKTEQVRKIRWWPTSGTYSRFFDDIVVNASKQVDENLTKKISDFDLGGLVNYKPEYLSGFFAKKYDIGFKEGWRTAKEEADSIIHDGIVEKINADEVRNLHISTSYQDIKFKHILLPLWISSYNYKNKVYSFIVNGQTGEVSGYAPISFWKILALTGIAVLIIGAGWFFFKNKMA